MTWSLVPAYAYLAVLTAVLTVIDIRTRTLPNLLTLTAYPIMALLLLLPAALDDRWSDLGRALLGSALTLLVFVGLVFMSPRGLGMGDAKLAGVLAMPLAFASWMDLLFAMAGAFVLSAIASIVLLLLRRVDRRSLIPFGPFLIGATWLIIVLR